MTGWVSSSQTGQNLITQGTARPFGGDLLLLPSGPEVKEGSGASGVGGACKPGIQVEAGFPLAV